MIRSSAQCNGKISSSKTEDGVENGLPNVLTVNVGGVLFTTHLSTLIKYNDSMLSVMFSGNHVISRDVDGHPFIDANPTYFGHILEYLRHETVPPADLAVAMYRQACYYGVGSLVDVLKTTPAVSRVLVRESYRDQFPRYAPTKRRIVELAMEKAAATNENGKGRVVIHAFRRPFAPEKPDFCEDHLCVVAKADVVVGPWDGAAGPEELIKCLCQDLREEGFVVADDPKSRLRCEYFCGDTEDLWNGTVEYCPKTIVTLTFTF